MGPYRPNLTKMTSQISWLLIGGEDLRKIIGKRRQGFGNHRQGKRKKEGRGGWGKARKKEGRGGWGKDKKSAEGGVGDDVIEKIKIIKK